GPQAGIILGRKDLVDAIKKNQLSRALRIDKLTLAALEETLRIYRDERAAIKEIPTLKMICQTYGSLAKKAERLLKLVGQLKTGNFSIELADGNSKVGGGALPLLELPSRLLCLVPKKMSSQFMERWLRAFDPPVITRLEKEKVLFDVRTLQDKDLKTIAEAIRNLAGLDVRGNNIP
ncbi:MAG: L-seryl-tRNA(Sec) selenium transferase, partial [Deltaproteobacteria bacterium]|nr:L-seryl-tRNA(Sec) selenium transferase [Deltaproteobacteria bacterium]